MQQGIPLRDHLKARCQAALEGRRILRFDDLLRMGPFLHGRMSSDLAVFSRLVARRLKETSEPVQELRTRLDNVGLKIGSTHHLYDVLYFLETNKHLSVEQPLLINLIDSRLRLYSATLGHPDDMERVIMMCLNRAVEDHTGHGFEDYLVAAMGWAFHRQKMTKSGTGIHTPKWVQRDGKRFLKAYLDREFGL